MPKMLFSDIDQAVYVYLELKHLQKADFDLERRV